MIDGKKVLAVIAARGGSKGVFKKNIRNIAGKPLIAFTIEEAKKSRYIDKLILSSDCEEIISVAKQFGCVAPFVRPKELAMDDTPGVLPVIHAIGETPGYDYVVLLQPTSPLRLAEDIDGCISQCVFSKTPSCVTVTKSRHHPQWMFYINPVGNKLKNVVENVEIATRRQDLPETYALNGAVYVAEITSFLESETFLTNETTAYIMPEERSLDIDCEIDIKIAEVFIKERTISDAS
jgi:N-acylneuraminate cytidylyltransferase